VAERARVAQLEHGPPDPSAFEGAVLATPEQRRVYDHAVSWYLSVYGDRPGRVVDLADAQWGRDRPDLGVRLTSRTPLVIETEEMPELRILRLGGDPAPREILEDHEVRIDVLRLAGDPAATSLRVCVTDLVRGEHSTTVVSIAETLPQLDEWLVGALHEVRRVADPDDARPGADCSWCSYVAGCPAHG
jgi:hypothetical protein